MASDNVNAMNVVLSNGEYVRVDKKSHPDLFWALRGGGGGNWGVIVYFHLQLTVLSNKITTFGYTVPRNLFDDFFEQWQNYVPGSPKALSFANVYATGKEAYLSGWYLGTVVDLEALMRDNIPSLNSEGVDSEVKNVAFDMGVWAEGNGNEKIPFHAASHVVSRLLSQEAWSVLFDNLDAISDENGYIILDPYGGRMSEIPVESSAFPYRKGVLFTIQYQATESKPTKWLEKFYNEMTKFVGAKSYVNYPSVLLGTFTANSTGTVQAGSLWNDRYFTPEYYQRLVKIKTMYDPSNFFRFPQSIPVKK